MSLEVTCKNCDTDYSIYSGCPVCEIVCPECNNDEIDVFRCKTCNKMGFIPREEQECIECRKMIPSKATTCKHCNVIQSFEMPAGSFGGDLDEYTPGGRDQLKRGKLTYD